MSVSIVRPSFSAGEWSPSLFGRIDLAKYALALETCRNFIVRPHGGVVNRFGTQFVCEVKDSSKAVRLIPFQFSTVQAYMLEFGDQYMRVMKDGGQVIYPAGSATDIVLSGTYQWTLSGSGTNEYYCEANGGGDPSLDDPLAVYEDVGGADTTMPEGVLGSLSAGEWGYGDNDTLGFNTIYVRLSDNVDPDTKANGYLEAGYPVEIATPFLEADLPTLKFTQSADTMYLTHPSYQQRKLTRTDHHVWTLSTVTIGSIVSAPSSFQRTAGSSGGPIMVMTAVDANGIESTISNTATGGGGDSMQCNAVSGAEYYKVYEQRNNSYGYMFEVGSNAWTMLYATDYTTDWDSPPPTAQNPFSGSGNYPGVVTFFEQRLVYARTNNDPQKIWGSRTADFDSFNKSHLLLDDDAYEFVINASQVNEVRWMVPLNELIIGTSGAEWKMGPGGNSNAITPSSVQLRVQSNRGASHVRPVVIGNTILFIQASGNVIYDMSYSLEADSYTGNSLTLLASHLFEEYELVDWAYQQNPFTVIWAVRDDGVLLGMTYAREHEVIAWHRHDTTGTFENVAALDIEGDFDEVYLVVNRTINSSTKRYIERFMPRISEGKVENSYFVDSGLSLDSPVTITGATQADPVVITANSHGFSDGDYVDIRGVGGMVELVQDSEGNDLTYKRYIVANSAANTFSLEDQEGNDVDGSGYSAFTSGGTVRQAVTSISGLDHLEGEEVVVLANGNVVKDLTVSSGTITLPNRASIIHIGLSYISDFETLQLDMTSEGSTLQDRHRDVSSLTVRLNESRAFWAGPNEDRLQEMRFRSDENYGEPIALFSGDKEMSLYAGDPKSAKVFIRNVDPVPLSILAVIPKVLYGDL